MKIITARTNPGLIIGLSALLLISIVALLIWFKAVPAADNNSIIVALEEPVDGGTYSGVSNIRGWAVAPVGIVKTEWILDGGVPQIIPYGGTRPDVQSQFPSYPDARESGFSRAVNFSNFGAGQHTITLRATDSNGDANQVTHTFNVVRFDNPFIADPAAVSLETATSTVTGSRTLSIENLLADGKRYTVRLDWNTETQGFAITQITPIEQLPPPGGGTATNRNPSITSDPVMAGQVGQPYRYTVTATDSDGDRLIYLLNTAPTGMTIDAASGLISWVPGAAGDYLVSVQVNDGRGGADIQIFHVLISDAPGGGTPANRSPSITSVPPIGGQVGQLYTYDVTATDPDGDSLSYSLATAPEDMTIDAAGGQIRWVPAIAGDYEVSVQVNDGRGGTATQSYSVLITTGGTPPPGGGTPPPGGTCCRVCTVGKACGDSCIAESLTCHQPPGCACDG